MRKILLLAFVGLVSFQAKSQDPIPEYCLENETVHAYLNRGTYPSDNYTITWIRDYCYNYPWNWRVEGNGVRLDQPLPVVIELANALDTVSVLYVTEVTNLANGYNYSMNVDKGMDSICVYNLIPGRTYNWKLEYPLDNGTTAEAASGQFKTTGTLRMLKIDNIFNVRDMGGWPTESGYPMKYGKIIRGSRLNVNSKATKIITEDGIRELRQTGVRAELDMRDGSNAPKDDGSSGRTYSYFGEDCPIYNVEQGYRSRINTFGDSYQSIEGILKLIEWLKADRPVYLHCSVGADRTGTVAYLVGALCGMTEDALCKDFELTSFSADKIENSAVRSPKNDYEKYERLVRQRTYKGRLDTNDDSVSYKFASMVDKIKGFPGETLQEKVYYHLSTGAKPGGGYLSKKVPTADLDWLINYLVGPLQNNGESSLNLEGGDKSQLNIEIVNFREGNPNPVITYTTSDPDVATVSAEGVITAVRGGTAEIKAELDGFYQTVTVNVAKKESDMPASVHADGKGYLMKGKNIIKNGSFEYADTLSNWTDGTGAALSAENFSVKSYGNGSDDRYIESKGDGDDASANSINIQWRISSGKTYVFGYKVKNSTDIQTVNNENLKVILTKTNASLTLEGYPSYDGNWTDVQYVFTNSDRYSKVQIQFSHLSQNGNNTCFDNFYLVEVEYSAGVGPVRYDVTDGNVYDLNGRKVGQAVEGIIIKDGKKVLIK